MGTTVLRRSRLLACFLLTALAVPLPLRAEDRAVRLVEAVPMGWEFAVRRSDGVVIVDGHPSFEIPPDSTPLVADTNSAFTVTPATGKRGPQLFELRLSPRRRLEHRLPGDFAARPVGVDPRWVYFDDGSRFDRETRTLVGGVDDDLDTRELVATRTIGFTPSGESEVRFGALYLLRHAWPDGSSAWRLARRLEGPLLTAELPPASTARICDGDARHAVVILDEQRALVLDADLRVEEEISGDAPVLSLHRARDVTWLLEGATPTCPAGLVKIRKDGVRQRLLPLPDDVRVLVAADHVLVLAAPGAPADRVVTASRHEWGYELDTRPLRDNGARFAHGLARAPALFGLGMVALPAVIGILTYEELKTSDPDKVATKQQRKRIKERAKELPRIIEILGPLPDPGSCPVEW